MRRSAAEAAGFYDPRLRGDDAEGCEDLKLYLAISEEHDFAAVPMVLTGYRSTGASMSRHVMRMIRSHHIVTEPYRGLYPDEVRIGRVYLALFYGEQELFLGNRAVGLRALRAAAQIDRGLTMRAVARHLATARHLRRSHCLVGAKDKLFPSAGRQGPKSPVGC
jgi:hypothetical protein